MQALENRRALRDGTLEKGEKEVAEAAASMEAMRQLRKDDQEVRGVSDTMSIGHNDTCGHGCASTRCPALHSVPSIAAWHRDSACGAWAVHHAASHVYSSGESGAWQAAGRLQAQIDQLNAELGEGRNQAAR